MTPALCCQGVPKSVVSESAASRNSVVAMALSWLASTGTSTKDLRIVSKKCLLIDWEAAIFAGRCWTQVIIKGGRWEEDACKGPVEQTEQIEQIEQTNSMRSETIFSCEVRLGLSVEMGSLRVLIIPSPALLQCAVVF